MSVFRAVYTSRPFGFEDAVLNQILMTARRANARDDVTGALICRADIYLQWLEGPEEQVNGTLQRIARDDRHVEMRVRIAGNVSTREFGSWAMLHDPAVSWIWTQQEVAKGAVERATSEDIEAFFIQLRDVSSMA